MDQENTENSCVICHQNLVEPRVLPCWHVACLHCILGMTQSGQGRAVSCRICGMTFLFENIRTLPRPINCKVCGKSATNPKKFSCCSDIYCTDCIKNRAVDGLVTCRNLCTTTGHSVNELPNAKLCQICFRLHTEPARDCGHSSCSRCCATPQGEPRPCSVCEAIAAPNPVPQNPQAPMSINAQAFVQRLNMLPGQILDPVDVRVIQQIGGLVQRLNVNGAQRIGPFDNRRYNEKDMVNDLPKVLMFYVTLALMLYQYGLCGWTCIIPALAMLSSRPKLQTCLLVCVFTNAGIIFYSLYHYFYQSAMLVGSEILFFASTRKLRTTASVTANFGVIYNIAIYAIVVMYFEPLLLITRPIACIAALTLGMLSQGRNYLA